MFDENIEDQLVLAPKLAELFANDEAFIFEIGLDEFGFEYRCQQLVLRIGFILAMHRTMKSIFRHQPHLNLDDKFLTLIHSRISLIPEQIEDYPDPNEYAKQCYIEAKQNAKDLGIEWEGMSLKEIFFEVCLRTEVEEEKLLLMSSTDTENEFWKIGHRDIFTLLFEKTFEYVNWELGNEVVPKQGVTLSLKKELSRDSLLKDFPLQRRRFNKFSLVLAVVVGVLVGGLTVRYIVMKYSEVQIARKEFKEAGQLHMEGMAKALVSKDSNSEILVRQARRRHEVCERRLKELEGFWVKNEDGMWSILSEGSFFMVCVVSGFGSAAAGFLSIWLLLALVEMSRKAKQKKLYDQYDNSKGHTPNLYGHVGTGEQ